MIFVLAVLAPDVIPHDSTLFFLGEEQLEEIIIFILGLTGFLFFRWKERQSNTRLEEKIKIQREASKISRSLTNTYSYIGETNRKLDIMKNISMNLLEIHELDLEKEKKFFDMLMESIYILGKSKKFILRFVDTETKKTLREFKSKKRMFLKINNEEVTKSLLGKNKSFIESNYHFIITSPKEINKTIAIIAISKNNQQQKLEDSDILKALASHSLFLYNYSKTTKTKTID